MGEMNCLKEMRYSCPAILMHLLSCVLPLLESHELKCINSQSASGYKLSFDFIICH